MQKKLIALAIAGLSSAAFAQSNVTVYGVADLTQESVSASGATAVNSNIQSRGRLQSNSSYIGFKGAEALGNGLTAVFQFESNVNADNSTGSMLSTGRDSYIGVAGGFGTVAAGTLTHPIRAMGAKVDFNPGASSAGFTGSMYGEVLGVKTGSDERAANAVAYISPNFNGFTGVIAYVNGSPIRDDGTSASIESAQNGNAGVKAHAWQIAGSYENGPLYIGLGWDKHTDPGAARAVYTAALGANPSGTTGLAGAVNTTLGGSATNSTANAGYNDSLTITRLAAKYSFSTGTSVSALWDKQKYEITNNAAIATDATRTAYMLGVNQNFGASNVWLQYAVAKDPSGSVCSTISCDNYGAKQWTLGYSYDLSKRTMIHALYSKISNDSAVAYDHYVGAVGLTGANSGADTSVWGVGLRHTF